MSGTTVLPAKVNITSDLSSKLVDMVNELKNIELKIENLKKDHKASNGALNPAAVLIYNNAIKNETARLNDIKTLINVRIMDLKSEFPTAARVVSTDMGTAFTELKNAFEAVNNIGSTSTKYFGPAQVDSVHLKDMATAISNLQTFLIDTNVKLVGQAGLSMTTGVVDDAATLNLRRLAEAAKQSPVLPKERTTAAMIGVSQSKVGRLPFVDAAVTVNKAHSLRKAVDEYKEADKAEIFQRFSIVDQPITATNAKQDIMRPVEIDPTVLPPAPILPDVKVGEISIDIKDKEITGVSIKFEPGVTGLDRRDARMFAVNTICKQARMAHIPEIKVEGSDLIENLRLGLELMSNNKKPLFTPTMLASLNQNIDSIAPTAYTKEMKAECSELMTLLKDFNAKVTSNFNNLNAGANPLRKDFEIMDRAIKLAKLEVLIPHYEKQLAVWKKGTDVAQDTQDKQEEFINKMKAEQTRLKVAPLPLAPAAAKAPTTGTRTKRGNLM